MKKKISVQKILTIVICAIILSYIAYNAFAYSYSPIDTIKLTEKSDYEESFEFDGFIVRDEEIIRGGTDGAVIPLVKDGKRVAKEDNIAIVCAGDEDASAYKELENAKNELEKYVALSNNEGANELDSEKLNVEIAAAYKAVMDSVCAGVYDNIGSNIDDFNEKSAIKQILSEGKVDVSAQITELGNKIKTLESRKISYTQVTAPDSGYYINSSDGYEQTVKYDDVMKLNASQIESAVKAQPQSVASGGLGKLVGSYRWYVIGTADKKYAQRFSGKEKIKVNFPAGGVRGVTMKVESVKTEGDKTVIILSSSLMNEVFANMRKGPVEVITTSVTGYKVPVGAVRFDEENNAGVYVLRGKIINFIKVETIYSDDEYAVVDSIKDSKKKILLYDEVIIKGKDLEDGNVIR